MVSTSNPVSSFAKSFRKRDKNCSGYFLLKWSIALAWFGEWTLNWKYYQVPSPGVNSCMIKTSFPEVFRRIKLKTSRDLALWGDLSPGSQFSPKIGFTF